MTQFRKEPVTIIDVFALSATILLYVVKPIVQVVSWYVILHFIIKYW